MRGIVVPGAFSADDIAEFHRLAKICQERKAKQHQGPTSTDSKHVKIYLHNNSVIQTEAPALLAKMHRTIADADSKEWKLFPEDEKEVKHRVVEYHTYTPGPSS